MKTWSIAIIAAIAGLLIVLAGTAEYGPGFSPDAVSYASTARNLMDGKGFVRQDGTLFTKWPPLFPVVLAFLGLLGLEIVEAARFFNAACFALSILVFHHILKTGLKSSFFVVAGVLAFFLSWPIVWCSFMIWTEPLFILIILFYIICLYTFVEKQSVSWLAAACIFAALGSLLRYAGASLIPAGALVVLIVKGRKSIFRGFAYSFAFGVASSVPLLAWMARNYASGGVAHGLEPSTMTLGHSVHSLIHAFSVLFFPDFTPLAVRWGIGLILLGSAVYFGFRKDRNAFSSRQGEIMGVMIIFMGVYCSFLLMSSQIVKMDDIGFRFTAPMVSCIYFSSLAIMEKLVFSMRKKRSLIAAKGAFLAFIGVFLSFQGASMHKAVNAAMTNGAHFFQAPPPRILSSSQSMPWLKENLKNVVIYSNFPEFLYVYCGLDAKKFSRFNAGFLGAAREMADRSNACIVHFNYISCLEKSSSMFSKILHLEPLFEHEEVIVWAAELKKDKESLLYANQAGLLLMKKGDLAGARECFELGAAIEPHSVAPPYNLACVYAEQRQIEKSIISLKKAVLLGFDNWEHLEKDSSLNNIRGTDYYKSLIRSRV